MPTRDRPGISLKAAAFDRARHVCAFFNSAAEQYEVLTPFVREGLQAGERAFYIVDPRLKSEHRAHLSAFGVSVDEAEKLGQLEIRGWGDAYLRNDRFDQDAMLALIEEVLAPGSEHGYPLTRLVANMEWALEDSPGVDQILEYETRLNYILPKYADPVICTYDLTRFDATLVMDMLRTHPSVLVGGVIQSNPFFVPPDELLRELRGEHSPMPRSAF